MAALNADVPEDLKKNTQKAAIDRKVTLQAAVAAGLQMWLDGPTVETGDFGTLTDQEYRYLKALLDILRVKPKFGLQGITGALDAWLLDHPVETRPHDSKRRKSSGH